MVYTLTLNPSLDYIVSADAITAGRVNRTSSESIYPGGKGINVSIMLSHLGVKNRVLGFLAGFTGKEIERRLKEKNCDTDFIHLSDGFSRINVKIRAEQETEINARGPEIPRPAVDALLEKTTALIGGDFLVLSGSIPAGLPENIYEQIMERVDEKDVHVVVDTTGKALNNALTHRPFLVKPNHHELGELFGVKLESDKEIIEYAQRVQKMGARNVLVSMAEKGALLVDENGTAHKSAPPEGRTVNSVGAGDSMVAGFIAGYMKNGSYEDAFYTGLASGSASAFSQWLAEKGRVDELLCQMGR